MAETPSSHGRKKSHVDTETQVIENMHHIEENTKDIKNNSRMIHMMLGLIILLMIIISGLAFYIGTLVSGKGSTPGITASEDIEVTVIDDARCNDCPTDDIITQLKTLPFLSSSTFTMKDFQDKGVEEYLKENNITLLPAVIFNTNTLGDGGTLTQYLTSLPDGQFNLSVGAKFNPFAKRSDKGFLVLEDDTLKQIKENSHIKGSVEAPITWVEYSDVQCPYCAKLHNDGTPQKVSEKFGEKLNLVFQHFPLDFHANAQKGAEGLECIAEQKVEALYPVIEEAYKKYPKQDITISGLVEIASEKGINAEKLNECIDSGKYAEKVKSQMTLGQEKFGITGTPGNVIINSKTGEYEIISGAYGAETFEKVINKMLAE